MENKALEQIVERHKQTENISYLEIFAGDDKKTGKKIYSHFLDLSKTSTDNIQNESDIYNIGVYGVFMNINPLSKPKRIKENIKKILYIFIDLDDAQEDHNNLIKETLKKLDISFSYNAKSGSGYHFLVPIDLDNSNENKIKGFLNYLKENCTNKVDLATADLGRLIRIPKSTHNKYAEGFELKTLHNHWPKDKEIKKNSENILLYQIEQKKGTKDDQYHSTIKREDIFFSTILNDSKSWTKYYKMLDIAKNRNDIFVKNLGFFIKDNPNYTQLAESFLDGWENSRIAHMQGWTKKARDCDYIVNYHELRKWINDNNLDLFYNFIEEQLKSSFLDKYEFYYLEDEKKENSHLMYYPEKDYYVIKSLNEILLNVYYDCLESGVDLVSEMELDNIDKWDDIPFNKQLKIIQDNIHKRIIKEKRLKTVFNINYAPIDDKFIYIGKKKYFNTYTKTELWDYYKRDDTYQFENIKKLVMNLCGNDEESYSYFNKWLGWIIQNPTQKLPTAIILQGKQGSGKGTFKNLILDEIFGSNCTEINQTHLESGFNEYLMGKQIIVANEVMHNENKLTLPNMLKNIVTDEYITISRKFKKEIIASNYTHWIFCTNSDNPLRMDEDDRRYSVFFSKKLSKDTVRELRKNIDYERKEYISYLKSLEIDFEEISEPKLTEAKKEIIELNKDSVERFRESLQQYDDLYHAFIKIFGDGQSYNVFSLDDGVEYITTDNFYLLYETYCERYKEKGVFNKPNFSKKLSNKGIKTIPKWYNNRTHRVYDISLLDQWIKVD